MTYVKRVLKYIAYSILGLLVTLCIYTFVVTDIMKKDYVNVFGYTYFVVSTGSMSGTIEVNDIIFVKITKDVEKNDVISYVNKDGDIITHRLIQIIGDKYIAQGDTNNVSDDPFLKKDLIGEVKLIISPSFILKTIAIFLILFIALSLVNFDKIMKKYVVNDNGDGIPNENKELPEDIFYSKKNRKEDKSSGLTVNIPVEEIEKIHEIQENEAKVEEECEVLEVEDIIDIDNNSIVTKERNNAIEKQNELLEQVNSLLRIKNNSLTTAKINKKWLVKYQYVYKLANILLLNDMA